MAKTIATVQVTPDQETLDRIQEIEDVVTELSAEPFNYDFLQPYVKQAAALAGEYYYALIEAKLPSTLVENLVYEFHRVLWGIPNQE